MTTFPERLGLEPVDPNDDSAGRRLTVTPEMLNVNGGLHGGVLATMIDTTMGAAVRASLEEDATAVTVSLTVTYLDAAHEGDELVARADVRKGGKTLSLVEADVTRGDDPIAHGIATFRVVHKD